MLEFKPNDEKVRAAFVALFLKTLRRVPNDIIQYVATLQFTMMDPCECVCGQLLCASLVHAGGIRARALPDPWFSRERVIFDTDLWGSPDRLRQRYGGTLREWDDIFYGVTGSYRKPLIEEAFAIRVAETVRVRRRRDRRVHAQPTPKHTRR